MSNDSTLRGSGFGSPSDTAFGISLTDASPGTVTAIRVALGVASALMLILGVALTVWPGRTLVVGAALLGINFVAVGLLRLAIGIFSGAHSVGLRILQIIMGLLLVLGGAVTLRNLGASTVVLLLIATITVGFGWIIEGIVILAESGGAASRGLAITFGVISIIAGIAVVATPGWTAVVFITFAAVLLIVFGLLGLIRAFTFGKAAKA